MCESLSVIIFSFKASSSFVNCGFSAALEEVKTKSRAPCNIISCLKDLVSRSTRLLMSLKILSVDGDVPMVLAYKSKIK